MKLLKALKDLSSNPKRTLLVVFALVLGIWGLGTVQVSYTILMKDLSANYQSTVPLNVVFAPSVVATGVQKISLARAPLVNVVVALSTTLSAPVDLKM